MPTQYTCPHCGTTEILALGQRFCTACRQSLDGALLTQIPSSAVASASSRPFVAGAGVVPYESGHRRARVTTAFLIMRIVLALILINTTLWGADVSFVRLVTVVHVLVYIGIVISFLLWFHRAYRNLPALGANGLNYTPGWAVGAWFVPFLNLVRPYQIMQELWQASSPSENPRDVFDRNLNPLPPTLGWWWGTFLLGNFISNTSAVFLRSSSRSSILTGAWLLILSELLEMVAAGCLIWIIQKVDQQQEERRMRIEIAATTPPPYPPPTGVATPYVSE